LSRLLREVEHGAEIVVVRRDRPVAKITPFRKPARKQSSYGMFAGQFSVADDFDADNEVLADLFGVAR
jgi:antitoxin (DNA-binding transcriptional repressor) of toxin-antitoxin stability system